MATRLARIHERFTRRNELSGWRNGIQCEHYGSPSLTEGLIGRACLAGAQAIEGLESLTWLDFQLKPQCEIRDAFRDEAIGHISQKLPTNQTIVERDR